MQKTKIVIEKLFEAVKKIANKHKCWVICVQSTYLQYHLQLC